MSQYDVFMKARAEIVAEAQTNNPQVPAKQ
jgi:hypothetical protein